MDWVELNCVIAGLQALSDKYKVVLADPDLSEDDRADASNDLAYAEILLDKYEAEREKIASN